jgi:shikimate dehydrogenase
MQLYGLIGYPLSHSFSKNYFSKKFEELGIKDAVYELFPIETIELFPALLKAHPQLKGINVTIPYKEQVLQYVHQLSDAVKEIGACNCIKIEDGQLKAFNTDVTGFQQSLLPFLQPHHTQALVLGTGGASKAVVWVLKQLQINYTLVSRKGGDGILAYEQLNTEIIKRHLLIINTTPLGMQPNVETKPSLPYDAITPKHLFFDVVYNPAKTAFLAEAERRGAIIKNGYEMLELQAEDSWFIWNS